MKRLALILLLAAAPAYAQEQPPSVDAKFKAALGELTFSNLMLAAELDQAKAQIADLKQRLVKAMADAQKPPDPPAK